MSEVSNLLAGIAALKDYFAKGRRALNSADRDRHVWIVQGDGYNRAKIRGEMSALPRTARLFKRGQMVHRHDIMALMQHPMSGGNEETTVRNRLKALRKARGQ